MVKIIDVTSDGGSNGGDPNKNPQEEENQNDQPQEDENQNDDQPQEEEENQNDQPQEEDNQNDQPQEEEENQNEQQQQQQQVANLPIHQQAQNLRIPEDLPNEINELILLLLERCDYSSLLCTSRAFREIITSPEFFERRSRLGRTEHVLYAMIGLSSPFGFPRWHILHRRNNYLWLSLINSLPLMRYGSAVVTIGHEIYIFGGCSIAPYPPVRDASVIDCRFHTWHYLPSMSRARNYAAAGVVDGNIYVIGGCLKRDQDWIEVFDVNTQIWANVASEIPTDASLYGVFGPSVVMKNKIYILDVGTCLVYEPASNSWESWGYESPRRWYWYWCSCVVDDMLYTIDPTCSLIYPIIVYDPTDVVWRPVMGVSRSALLHLDYLESRMANLGGKLVVLGRYLSGVWCTVIALERRENGEIWGNVESISLVLSSFFWPLIENSRTVTV